jgi:thiamine pyrophosphokinase
MAHACDHPVYTTTAGCDICLSTGIRPELVVGDVQHLPDDSIPANWKTVQLLDPESTDFECLLRILPPHIRDLTVLGGIEERLDLLLSHLLIASALPENFQISFEHHGQALWRVTPDTPWHGTPELGSTLSLLPMSQVQCVVTRGLDWDLDHEDMNGENKLGRSHHVTGPVSVSIEHGSLFLWRRIDGSEPPSNPLTRRKSISPSQPTP